MKAFRIVDFSGPRRRWRSGLVPIVGGGGAGDGLSSFHIPRDPAVTCFPLSEDGVRLPTWRGN